MKKTLTFPSPILIHGNGTSLWGPSKGTFRVDKAVIYTIDYDEGDGEEPYNIQLFSTSGISKKGQKTKWHQCTDTQIEREVEATFLRKVEEAFPEFTVKCIGWSERSTQPVTGWDFDVICKRKS